MSPRELCRHVWSVASLSREDGGERALTPTVQVVDLAGRVFEPLLTHFYQEIYLPAFPIQDEREELDEWRRCLDTPGLYGVDTHVILAGYNLESDAADILGGIVVEYYRKSNVGLLTYLVVSPDSRGLGLGHRLTQAGLEAIASSAKSQSASCVPYAFLAEANNPKDRKAHEDTQDPYERLEVLGRLGFQAFDFPYIQPKLKMRERRYYGLKLLVHETSWQVHPVVWSVQDGTHGLKSDVLRNFLEEFYLVLEDAGSLEEPDFKSMALFLEGRPTVICHPLNSSRTIR